MSDTELFAGFEGFDTPTQKDPHVTIHGIKQTGGVGSNLPPLLLLHGFPQTHHIWHAVVDQLKSQFNIVALDLRGYGASTAPADVSQYAKSLMARDCVRVMETLGFSSFFILAHDRGARVAHKLCVDYPERVKKAIFLDICPTLVMYTTTNFEFARSYFHWFFLIQKEPLPETLISQNPRRFAEMFMGGRQVRGLDIFKPHCLDQYVHNLGDPAIVHAMCQDYRASATLDLDEAREDIKAGRMIQCPLMVLWGRTGVIEKCFDAVKEWQAVTAPHITVKGYNVDSGHYVPEQAPDEVVEAVKGFFS